MSDRPRRGSSNFLGDFRKEELQDVRPSVLHPVIGIAALDRGADPAAPLPPLPRAILPVDDRFGADSGMAAFGREFEIADIGSDTPRKTAGEHRPELQDPAGG